ncbi:innexin inx7-like [Trichogramma pretiosum]|uniref:innexin inx7-like n=1 Tax=Trichogramma pretiosum TaxID=7493 RepID=UPI0006C9D9A1|nr:innexin inx7-like [Trichogramma pretiosum]
MPSFIDTFAIVKSHVKLRIDPNSPAVDNLIFKLHYRATFLILVLATVLVSSRQYIGEHIRCIADKGVAESVINTFCFFTSTYTIPRLMNSSHIDSDLIPHIGVGTAANGEEITHHAYYQWVPFVLGIQAIFFYLPHLFWRTIEGGKLRLLVTGLQTASLALREQALTTESMTIMSRQDRSKRIQEIRQSFLSRLHMNRSWALYLSMCEVLNLLNLWLQMHLTNKFLGEQFYSLGFDLAETGINMKGDALDRVFPKVTKCTFHKFGASGTVQKHDAMCVMALNIINEKIYIFLWYWFNFLAVLTVLGLVYRLFTFLLHGRSKAFNKWVFRLACPGSSDASAILEVTQNTNFGDWLFLYYIAKNVENIVFKEIIEGLSDDMMERNKRLYAQLPQEIDDDYEKSPKTPPLIGFISEKPLKREDALDTLHVA